MLTIHDLTPISLCLATQELFDAKKFQSSFCDNLILRLKEEKLSENLMRIKRDLNSFLTEKKFFDGYKTVIISNLDKIIGLVSSRYMKVDLKLASEVIASAKDLIEKVMKASNFQEISQLEPTFKSKITLPVYELFSETLKRTI
ncbi:MAG: hypothetical protein DRP00_00055 [Candidatus Aenigmatarchaeota archaeon]|nr:MAG: hypothetical protein DRP00_00055 [Candidatus Aenigmarchaeota archaeon]